MEHDDPGSSEDEASIADQSRFHMLLKQLADEHDRELGLWKTQAQANSTTPQLSPVARQRSEVVWGKPSVVRQQTARQHTGDIQSCLLSPSHEPAQLVTAADTMIRVRTLTSMENCNVTEPPGDLIKLHHEWCVNSDELRLSHRNFSFTQEDMRIVSMLSTDSHVYGVANNLIRRRWPTWRDVRTWVRVQWEVLGIICILFDLVWIPIQLGFNSGMRGWILGGDWTCRIYWTLDILVKCCVAFIKCQRHSRKELRRKFKDQLLRVRSFGLDVFIVIADWTTAFLNMDEGNADVFGLLRIGRIPRILRILRVMRLARIVQLEQLLFLLRDDLFVSAESVLLIMGMVKNLCIVLVCCHVAACVWFYVGENSSDVNWVCSNGLCDPDVPLHEKYIVSFHWVIAQWTPAPIQVSPQNVIERYVCVAITILGIIAFSALMGAVTASITRLRTLGGQELSHFFVLRRYLRENGISRGLTVRICRYTDRALEMHRKHTSRDKVHYLKFLTGPLCVELQKEIFLPYLCKLEFFVNYNDWDPEAMSHLCYVALGRASVAKGDIIFSLGAKASRMYLTVTGALVYQRRRGLRLFSGKPKPRLMARVGSSVWCCEASLWVRWYHFGSMFALIESEMVEVDSHKFREVTVSRGSVFSRSALYAQSYLERMWDFHGYAWDVPSSFLYPGSEKRLDWWQREVIDAEMREAAWWSMLSDAIPDMDVDQFSSSEPEEPEDCGPKDHNPDNFTDNTPAENFPTGFTIPADEPAQTVPAHSPSSVGLRPSLRCTGTPVPQDQL